MATFKQHIPAFVDLGATPAVEEFSSTEELLALEVVRRYGTRKDFSHFAISENELIEVNDDGFDWWVIGSVSDPSIVNLPKWAGWRFRAELADGSRAILGEDVVSSCGGVLTLRDGTKARDLGGLNKER